jgi:hypothetical protein
MGKRLVLLGGTILFGLYVISNLMGIKYGIHFLSPLIAFISGGMIFYQSFMLQKKTYIRVAGVFMTLALFLWAISDILSFFFHFLLIGKFGYGLTSAFLIMGITLFIFARMRKNNITQMMLDILFVSGCVALFVWVFVFGEGKRHEFMLTKMDWMVFVSLILDLIAVVEMVIYSSSLRRTIMAKHLAIFPVGILIYFISDLAYIYGYYSGTYSDPGILDIFFLLSFLLLGGTKPFTGEMEMEGIQGMGAFLRKSPYWLVLPFGLILLFDGVNYKILFVQVLMTVLYIVLSGYVEKSIFEKKMVTLQEEKNKELEKKVAEKTMELNYMLSVDTVTGLYNARSIAGYLENEMRMLREDEKIVLFYIDLNRYRKIKMLYGNKITDKLLKRNSKKIKAGRRAAGKYGNIFL